MTARSWIWGRRDTTLHLGPLTVVWGSDARLWVPGNHYAHKIKAYGLIVGNVALVTQLGLGRIRADTQTGATQES